MTTGHGEIYLLHLLRHAHAAWPAAGRGDFDRTLDERGRKEAADVARQAQARKMRPERIVCSPAARCQETSQIFTAALQGIEVTFDEALYCEGVDAYLKQITQHAGCRSLMLIGHNPMIEAVATMFIPAGPVADQLAPGYPTAGLLTLEFDQPLSADLDQRGRVLHLITPAFL